MNIKKTVQKLDKMVSEGKILEAFDKYFDSNVLTHDNHQQKTTSKQEKRDLLVAFFEEFSKTKKIKLHEFKLIEPISFSKFTFVLEKPNGEIHQWHETIKRTWHNDLVVEEYYSSESFDKLIKEEAEKRKLEKKGTKTIKLNVSKKESDNINKDKKKSKSSKEIVSAKVPSKKEKIKTSNLIIPKVKISEKKKPLAKIVKNDNKVVKTEPVKVAKSVISNVKPKITNPTITIPKKTPTSTPVPKAKSVTKQIKADNLTLIEGIGPKIASILKSNNIAGYNDLSKATVVSLNKILEAAGGTYKSHNPSTWPMQAKLAATGKIDELNELKKKIVSGVLQK